MRIIVRLIFKITDLTVIKKCFFSWPKNIQGNLVEKICLNLTGDFTLFV